MSLLRNGLNTYHRMEVNVVSGWEPWWLSARCTGGAHIGGIKRPTDEPLRIMSTYTKSGNYTWISQVLKYLWILRFITEY